MSFLDNLRIGSFKDDDDDYGYDDEEEYEDDYEDEDDEPRKGGFGRILGGKKTSDNYNNNVTSMRSSKKYDVVVVKPTNMTEAHNIVQNLIDGKATVVNLEGIDVSIAQRIIDYTAGACYAVGGNLQSVSTYIFVVSPRDIDILGDIKESGADNSSVIDIASLSEAPEGTTATVGQTTTFTQI